MINSSAKLEKKLTSVITNGFDEDDIVPVSFDTNAKDTFRITYTGTLNHFNIDTFCEGLRLCVEDGPLKDKNVELYIVGYLDQTKKTPYFIKAFFILITSNRLSFFI